MKYIFLYLGIAIAIFIACNSKEPQTGHPKFVQHFTWEQVQAIAKEYGIADSVTLKNSNGLMYHPDTQSIHAFMKQRALGIAKGASGKRFRQRSREIQSLDEYWALIDSLPYEKRVHGTEAECQAKKKDWSSPKWNVYIHTVDYPYLLPVLKSEDNGKQGSDFRLLLKHKS